MPPSVLVASAEQALLVATLSVAPVLLVAAGVGFGVAAFQAATHIQDPALGHLPRLAAVAAALVLTAPWIGAQVTAFASRALELASR